MSEDTKQHEYQWQVLDEARTEELSTLYSEFTIARDQRDDHHDGFDGMNLLEWVEFNAKTGSSYIEPRKNATDVNIVTGIPREKAYAVASNIFKMNLEPSAHAFDKQDHEDAEIGRAFTYLLRKSNELDNDEMKKLLRILYLLEQGTVFIEESWVPRTKMRKTMRNKKFLDPATGFKGLKWDEKEETTYHAERRILDLTSVYLGNINVFDINKQPYIFTREVMSYAEAKAIYGNWSEWHFVTPGKSRGPFTDDGATDVPYRDFRLEELGDQQVEILKYQNIWSDKYQIVINGVMMLPANFGLPWNWVSEEDEGKCYSITKTVLEPISPYFAYGKSMMAKVRVHAELLDELLRLLIHKTKQSAKPPVGNMTGMTLTPRIFDPGTLWEGVNPDKIKRLIDHDGVTASEYQLYNLVRETVDNMTVSPSFQGQKSKGGTTATEIIEMQRQAQLTLGLTLFAVRHMEEKCNYLRLQNILENWTQPTDERVEMVKDQLVTKRKYRSYSLENATLRNSVGTAEVEFTDFVPTPKGRKNMSYNLLNQERRGKKGKQRIYISLPLLQYMRARWFIRVNPTERESDDLNKVLFTEKIGQAMQFFGPDQINIDSFKREFAAVWGSKFDEIFTPSSMNDLQTVMGQRGGAQPAPEQATKRGASSQIAQSLTKGAMQPTVPELTK
jgi:hypothetical protein